MIDWKNVNKELPKEHKNKNGTIDVLCFFKHGHICQLSYFPKMNEWNLPKEYYRLEITHWAYINKPEEK